MPGPKSRIRTRGKAAPNSPPPKVAARLAVRQAAFVWTDNEHRLIPASGPGAQTYHKPGSQNRKK